MTMPRQLPALLFFLLLLPLASATDTLSGKVSKIVDGDTVYVLDAEKTRHKVRLAAFYAVTVGSRRILIRKELQLAPESIAIRREHRYLEPQIGKISAFAGLRYRLPSSNTGLAETPC